MRKRKRSKNNRKRSKKKFQNIKEKFRLKLRSLSLGVIGPLHIPGKLCTKPPFGDRHNAVPAIEINGIYCDCDFLLSIRIFDYSVNCDNDNFIIRDH